MMDESEKRGRHNVVARRQQHNSVSTPSTAYPLHKNTQQRTKRKMSDLPIISGQAAASLALPEHLDFSFRDKNDATAKRRFQVKVPCRLMAILALVFVVVPALIFLHKEMHIHDDHHESKHFKSEKYVNVNTEDMFTIFRLATANQSAEISQRDDERDSPLSAEIHPAVTKVVVNNLTKTIEHDQDKQAEIDDDKGNELDNKIPREPSISSSTTKLSQNYTEVNDNNNMGHKPSNSTTKTSERKI